LGEFAADFGTMETRIENTLAKMDLVVVKDFLGRLGFRAGRIF
jgi:hypothetical protein